MKNQILNFIIATGLAAVIANTPALAENNHKAAIPFSFNAGGVEYAAGVYEVSQMGYAGIVKLTSLETLKSHIVPTPIPIDSKAAASPKLVFQVTADGYKLSEVWLQGAPGMKTFNSSKSSEAASVRVVAIR